MILRHLLFEVFMVTERKHVFDMLLLLFYCSFILLDILFVHDYRTMVFSLVFNFFEKK